MPCQRSAAKLGIERCVEGFAVDHLADQSLLAAVIDGDIMFGEYGLNAVRLKLIVDHAGRQDFTCSLGRLLAVDDKEVLQRLAAVKLVGEVSEVNAKLHRLIVHLAVGPSAQQRRSGIGVGAVAGIVDI